MADLPQSNDLNEIQRAMLSLENRLLRRLSGVPTTTTPSRGRASTGGTTQAASSSTPAPVTLAVTPATSGAVSPFVQTTRLQTITLDPSDNLPLIDEDDCATVEVQDVPIVIEPLTAYVVTPPLAGGTMVVSLPSDFDETTTFVHISGPIQANTRIEISPNGRSVVFLNDAEPIFSGTVTVALSLIVGTDPGIEIQTGRAVQLKENEGLTGLELVIYYDE
jgi:hypothetical protein